jgi:hypothetical protein
MATLDQIEQEASRLSPFAHIATVGPDGKPDVARTSVRFEHRHRPQPAFEMVLERPGGERADLVGDR